MPDQAFSRGGRKWEWMRGGRRRQEDRKQEEEEVSEETDHQRRQCQHDTFDERK